MSLAVRRPSFLLKAIAYEAQAPRRTKSSYTGKSCRVDIGIGVLMISSVVLALRDSLNILLK